VRLTGAEFLQRYRGSTDAVTTIAPDKVYPVRDATAHPIYEHARVKAFRELLAGGAGEESAQVRLGELMFESHESYSRCGLGSDGTDRLVALARAAGPAAGIYGAKITGGGSGGTVAILARRGARAAVEALAARYRAESGQGGHLFVGSSPGARAFGVRTLVASGD
jgi:L-arabinokinase